MKLLSEFDDGCTIAKNENDPGSTTAAHSDVSLKTQHLLYFPDYSETNPYQRALYAEFHGSWRARPGSLEEAARLAAAGEDVIFHLHWPEMLFADCDTADLFTQRAHGVLGWLRHLRRYGGRSVWTAHNAMPHDCANAERQLWFHRELAATVDAIHAHSSEAIDSLDQLYGIKRDRAFVVPHGTHPRQPVEHTAKALARATLGLQPDSIVFAFLGQLRAYKGIERLVAAFQLVRRRRHDVEILIGGKPVPATMAGRWARVGQTMVGAVVCEGYLSDENFGACLAAADAMVLPYETVLTSGSAHMALECGIPLIVPNLPALDEFRRAEAALVFDGMDVKSLADAMERFADLSVDDRVDLSANAVRLAGARTWPLVGAEMARQLSRVVPNEEPAANEDDTSRCPSLKLLYERAHALAQHSASKMSADDSWKSLLPERVFDHGDSLRIIAERALRAGWVDGCSGIEIGIDLDVAARIDQNGGDPAEPELRGYIDLVDGHRIAGWAVIASDAQSGGEASWEGAGSIWVCENDIPIAEIATRLARPDVQAIGLAYASGFDDVIARGLAKPLTGRIDLRSGCSGRRICEPFLTPELRNRPNGEPPSLNATPNLRVHLDGICDGVLCGWAQDIGNPNRTVFIDLEINEVRHRNVGAATFRHDLATAGIGNGRHAFELAIPAALCQLPEVHVRIVENGRETVLVDTWVATTSLQTYRTTFSPDEYLRWAYLHDTIPVGLFATSYAVRAWFDINLRLLNSRPRDEQSFDIIMPVFNRRGVVGGAIASVIAQSHDNWRLIIIDDASQDGTADELAALAAALDDPRITLITLDAHVGVSRARNTGLARANADLVAYLDSDNSWHRDFLRVMSSVMNDKPDVNSCYCGQEVWQKPAGMNEPELRTVRASPFNRSYLERHNTIDLNAFVHRRTLYERLGGFHCDLNRLVDWELILRYTEAQPACFVPALLSRYNLDAASNRISCLEPLECAEILIACERLPLLKALPDAIKDTDVTPPPLDILLVGEAYSDAEYWLTLNLAWIDPGRDRLWYIPAAEGYTARISMQIPASETDVPAGRVSDDDRNVLVVSAEWGARADWRSALGSPAHVDTATGRLVEREETNDGPRRYIDLTPAKIASLICDWNVNAARHAISCTALPTNFLWVSHRRALHLHAALETLPTVEGALLHFYNTDMITPGERVNLYLPDLITFRIQGAAAIG